MIEYRTARKNEADDIKALCIANNIDFAPPFETIFVALEDSKIVGVCALKKAFHIDPLINISAHAQVGQILAEKVMACASLATSEVYALVRDAKIAEQFERYGLEVTDTNVSVMKKEV